MATAGVGVDMLEIERMERVLRRRPRFAQRVFTEEERAYCDKCARPAEHYAARFAAREAVVKALGTGFSRGIGMKDVEILTLPSGKPELHLHGEALARAESMGVRALHLSLSHERDMAGAVVILES